MMEGRDKVIEALLAKKLSVMVTLIIFPRPLTVEEERVLILEFQGVVSGIERGVKGAMKLTISKVQKEIYASLLDRLLDYIRLEKPESNTYRLSISVGSLNAFNLRLPGTREQAGDRLAKRMDKLIAVICDKIGMERSSVKIITTAEKH